VSRSESAGIRHEGKKNPFETGEGLGGKGTWTYSIPDQIITVQKTVHWMATWMLAFLSFFSVPHKGGNYEFEKVPCTKAIISYYVLLCIFH